MIQFEGALLYFQLNKVKKLPLAEQTVHNDIAMML